MSNILFYQGRTAFATKTINFTSDTIKGMLVDLATAGGAVTLVSSSTNATPIVVTTTTTHGYANGDIVVIGNHSTNTAANGTWQIAGVTGTTFQLKTRVDATNSTGNGVGATTGYCVNVSSVAQFNSSMNGTRVGTDVALGTLTSSLGVEGSANFTWTAVPSQANPVRGVVLYDGTPGSDASNPLIAFYDGKYQITACATAASSATTIVVERLWAAIPNSTVLVFSNGASATLTAQANIGDRSLTVSALAAQVTGGSTADATTLSAGLPVTPNGGNITFSVDTTSGNKLFFL